MKKTRWISLLAAGVLALGLVLSGCSSKEPESQGSSSSQAEQDSQETEARVPTI